MPIGVRTSPLLIVDVSSVSINMIQVSSRPIAKGIWTTRPIYWATRRPSIPSQRKRVRIQHERRVL